MMRRMNVWLIVFGLVLCSVVYGRCHGRMITPADPGVTVLQDDPNDPVEPNLPAGDE